jgi:quinol-cytochrome oxidoreductase complex cytochrome b subunit
MIWWQWVVKILLGIILVVLAAGAGIFGYICTKAQARKWGAGCFTIMALSIVAFYFLIFHLW